MEKNFCRETFANPLIGSFPETRAEIQRVRHDISPFSF